MIPFTKMHGLGNDFVVLDNRAGLMPALHWAAIADRHFGIGCDQVVVLDRTDKADVFMRIYNADGGQVESCGNASRCVAWLLKAERQGIRAHATVRIETLAGIIEAEVESERHITIDMGPPFLDWHDIPLARRADTLHLEIALSGLQDPVGVSMGNPHMVFFVPDISAVPLQDYGPQLEHHPLFPLRANVGIAQISLPLPGQIGNFLAGEDVEIASIHLRVWERGAGLTLACGTGACAALVAAHLRGLTGRRAIVHLPGGALGVEWREQDGHVLMTGPAAVSFRGEFDEKAYGV